MFDGLALIAPSGLWTTEDHHDLQAWFSEYIKHLQSPHCRQEAQMLNNHGTCFDLQYLSILQFLKRRAVAHPDV
jgi:hypothetical protein